MSRTILVVDDETDVLRLLQRILTEEGYEIVTAKSGDAAIQAFKKMERHPDLLLTDVVMPGMSGPMLADQLRALYPELKVLFISGYDDRDVVRRYVVEQGFHLISKPFTVKSLRNAIESVLEAPKKTGAREPAR